MKQKQTITHRFLKYLILIIIGSNLLVAMFLYGIMRDNAMKQAENLRQNLMESNLTMMQQYFDDVDHIADAIIYNRDIIRLMRNKQDTASDLTLLRGIESQYYYSNPDLKMSFFKSGHWTNMYSIQEEQAIPIPDYRYKDWYQEIIWTRNKKVLMAEEKNGEGFGSVQTCVYKIEDIYSPNVVGYLKIDMDMEYLKERFLHSFSKIAGATILDGEGNVLFYDKMEVRVPAELLENNREGTYEDKDYIITYGTSESTGWHLCLASSKAEILRAQNRIIPVLIFMLLVIVGFTFLISKRSFSIITVNYERLAEGMEQVKRGNLTTRVQPDTEDEINILIQEFNSMMRRIDELIKRVESEQLLVKEAEIKALQQQINPHFIYNILETIMGLASEGLDNEVIEVSTCLSDMLRYNTRFENVTVIAKELEQIKNYVTVIKIRFEDRFEVYYDVDEECMDCQILKFTLQPLLENAISHGLSETETGGMLRIRIKKEEDQISIMIYDNGTGIEKEKLQELNERLKVTGERPLEFIEQYKSLGILNVHLRSKLFYGDGYSIEIFSKETRGTCISIKIPFVRKLTETTGGGGILEGEDDYVQSDDCRR